MSITALQSNEMILTVGGKSAKRVLFRGYLLPGNVRRYSNCFMISRAWATLSARSSDEEAAGKEICIDPAGYPELSDTDAHTITEDGLTLEDLIGFSLLDQEGSTAGTIADILDFSGNICLELSGSGALLPFHDDLLIDLDPELRTVTLRIDKGLL